MNRGYRTLLCDKFKDKFSLHLAMMSFQLNYLSHSLSQNFFFFLVNLLVNSPPSCPCLTSAGAYSQSLFTPKSKLLILKSSWKYKTAAPKPKGKPEKDSQGLTGFPCSLFDFRKESRGHGRTCHLQIHYLLS